MSDSSRRALVRAATSLVVLLFLAAAGAAPAATFNVNEDGSATDLTGGTGACATTNGGCSLHAAIQSVNAQAGSHTITFSIAKVTLTANLPAILNPVTIDGGGSRTEIVGGPGPAPGAFGGLILGSTATPSTVRNLVIGYVSGAAIALIDGGKTVENCYLGTDTTGTIAHPNSGAGITVTTTALGPYPVPSPPPVQPPDISGVQPTTIGHASDAAKGNVISGNQGLGVDISGERTVKVTVANNLIGTNAAGTAAIPNGLGGVKIVGNAFANTIGPGNVISGNASPVADAVSIGGKVWEPNVVTGNVIGPAKDLSTNLGNWRTGIVVDSTRYDPKYPEQVATIGPGNVVGYALEDGVSITGACEKVQLIGNWIGIGSNNAAMGNGRDGVRIGTSGVSPTDPTTHGHLVGGTTAQDRNVVSANGTTYPPGGSGIHLATSSATNITIQGNVIGRDGPNLADHGNRLDGITIAGGGNNTVGGFGAGQANVIAGNGRNGVKVTSSGGGWANQISGNSIFGNGKVEAGLGIDLDYAQQGVDPADNSTPGPDPNTAYANYGQNAPVIGSGANVPHYDPVTGNVVVDWTLDTSASTPVLLQFFANDAAGLSGNGEGKTYLGQLAVVTDGLGHAAGVAPVTPASPFDSRGSWITITATATNPVADLPGPTGAGPANNTSEFSSAAQVPNPGVLQFSSSTYSVGESAGSATITVTRTGGSDGAVSIDYLATNGTATQPLDYLPAAGTLNWADGDTASRTFAVSITPDTTFEGNETVNLALSNPTGWAAVGAPSSAVLTINDDDTQPAVSIGDVAALEGNSGTTPFGFTVTLSNPSAQTVTVDYATANGTASSVSDYAAAAGTLTFNPGVTSQPVTVNVNGDATNEPDETFFVNVSNATNASILDPQGQGTIQNDDAATPTFTVAGVTQGEGNSGTTTFTFTVSLSPAAAGPASVQAATSDGSATTADGDYVASTQTLNFAAGETSKPFSVTVNGDVKFEANETFTVNLSANSPGTAIGGGGVATGTITNDDTQPAVSIGDVAALEGNSGTTPFGFTVTLSNPSAQTVTVDYATANGTASSASDYAAAAGTLTFSPGVTSQPVTVNVNGDATDEPDETFFVNLSNPANATVADGQGQGTIQNDDSTTPTFTVAGVTQGEGNSGTTTFTFTVSLSPAAAGPVSVQAATTDGTATTADGDYVASTQTLNFAAGETSKPFSVTVNGDVKFEANETFTVNLSANSPGTAIGGGGVATGTITNDDTQPTVSIGDVAALEGNSGTTAFTFTASLSNASYQTVTVDYATTNGTASSASDYAAAAGTLTFNPGVTTQPVTVNVNGDATDEPDETFFVNLSNPANATVADGQGQGTIQNDDSTTPTFTVAGVTQGEGNSGTTTFTFTVSLSPAAAGPVSVQAATTDGTATTADGDYVASTQTLNFAAGETSKPFSVTVNGDVTYEPDESFSVVLSANSVGTALGAGGTAAGTITGDDPQPSISLANVTAPAAAFGSTTFTFTLTLSNPSSGPVSVSWATADGTATAAAGDYVPANGTVTFPPGTTTMTFSVTITTNATSGPPRTFFVNLSAPVGGSIATLQATGTILPAAVGGAAVIPVLGRFGAALLALLLAGAGLSAIRRLL